MKRRKIQRGRLSAEQWAERSAELRPVLAELTTLSDDAAAETLNARGVPALGGGRWQGLQVTRVRRRLDIKTKAKAHVRRQDAHVQLFNDIRANIVTHFRREPAKHELDYHLVEHVAWLTFAVYRIQQCVEFNTIDLTAAAYRRYENLRAQLEAALAVVRIASPEFGIRPPPGMPKAKTSWAHSVLDDDRGTAEKFAAAVKLKLAASTDTDTATANDSASAGRRAR